MDAGADVDVVEAVEAGASGFLRKTEGVDDVIAAIKAGATKGLGVDIDPDLAEVAYAEVKAAGLQVHLSVDPTQIGYGYDDRLGERNALEIGRSIQQSSGEEPVLMLDMEDADYVTRTLALRDRLAGEGIPVAQTLQAYLKRTGDDLAPIIASGGSVPDDL